MIEPLLTDEEIFAIYAKDFDYKPQEVGALLQAQHKKTMDAILHPEWKDKPDSEGWWWIQYSTSPNTEPYKCIQLSAWQGKLHICNDVGAMTPETIEHPEWKYVKWTKAFVPEVEK